MHLTSQSEWMKAQKHADVMAPNGHFDVIQTSDETSVFFSLGTDNILWATKEVQSTSVGWNREDLSSNLSSLFGDAKIHAKSFALSQNAVSGKWDLVLAVTAGDSDHLFISQNNDYSAHSATAPGITWNEIKFDAQDQTLTKVQIADVFVLNNSNAGSTCVVDIWRTPGTNNSLDRYFITPDQTPQWNKHLLPIDLDAGSINSVLGQRNRDRVAGIYTHGLIDGKEELIYAPLYNVFRPDAAPTPARLAIPPGTTSIASAADHVGHSCLFISHPAGLSVFPSTAQGDGATPVSCIDSTLVAGASQLSAMTIGFTTSVWGRNAQGGLFYTTCQAGNETQSEAWSAPVVVVPQVESFAFYNSIATNSHTLFAHIDGQKIVELDQDPVTTTWRQRSIILPSTDINDVVEFSSYTTRVEVFDDNQLPEQNAELSITSVSPVPVYINDVYYILNPKIPVTAKTDGNGSVTIIQQTDTLAVVCYDVLVGGTSVLIDPSTGVMQRLQTLNTGEDLGAVKITDAAGVSRPLLPSSTSSGDKDAAAQAIKQFCDIKKNLKPDGSTTAVLDSVNVSSGTHVMSLTVNRSAVEGQRLNVATTPAAKDYQSSSVLIKIGDFFRMIGQSILDGLHTLEVHVVDGIHIVLAKIGGVVYHAVLNCISAIAHAVQWVFDQIKVLWDDLVAWLGFLFAWKDIVRTHSVMKNLMKQYVRQAFDSIGSAEEKVSAMFEGLEEKINTLTDVKDPGIKIGSYVAQRDANDGSSSPQSHWGINQAKSNMPNATMSSDDNTSVLGGLETILHDLETLFTNEWEYIKTMVDQLRTQVVEPYHDLTPVQVVKRLMGIISDLLLKSAKNIIVKVLDIIKALAETMLNILDAPLNIPILGPLYKQIAGADLSVLDLVVLVISIPTTIVYKIATGSAPWADNAETSALINATSFQAIKDMVNPVPNSKAVKPMVANKLAVHNLAATQSRIAAPVSADAYTATYRVFTIVARFFGAFTAIMGQVITDAKWALGSRVPKPLQIADAANVALSMVPTMIASFDHTGTWEVIMGNVVADINILKTLVGAHPLLSGNDTWKQKINPFTQIVFQIVSFPPPIGSLVEGCEAQTIKPSGFVNFSATALGKLAGVCNPAAMILDVNPTPQELLVSAAFLAAANVSTGLQAILMLVSGSMLAANT